MIQVDTNDSKTSMQNQALLQNHTHAQPHYKKNTPKHAHASRILPAHNPSMPIPATKAHACHSGATNFRHTHFATLHTFRQPGGGGMVLVARID